MANRLSKELQYIFDRGQEGWSASGPRTFEVLQAASANGGYDDYRVGLFRQWTAERGGTETWIRYDPLTNRGGYYVFYWPARAARPRIPPSIKVKTRAGWNAKGDSIYLSAADFAFRFDYAKHPNGGVIVGVAAAQGAGSQAFTTAEIVGGVMLRDGSIEVVSRGLTLAVAPYTPQQQPAIAVRRVGSQVIVSVGDWAYSVVGQLHGAAFVRAMPYTAGDYINNPALSFPVVGGATGAVGFRAAVPDFARAKGGVGFRLKKLAAKDRIGFAGWASGWVDASGRAKAGVGFGVRLAAAGGTLRATLPGLSVFGGSGEGSKGLARLPRLSAQGDGGFYIVPGGGALLALLPPAAYGSGLVGFIGNSDITLPALACGGGDYAYGFGRLRLPRLRAFGDEGQTFPGLADLIITINVAQAYQSQLALLVSIREQVGVSVELSLTALFAEALFESLSMTGNVSVSTLLNAILTERVSIVDALDRIKGEAVQYATNVLTGAVSRYEGFDFVSFASVGQDTYAAAENGIYRVTHNSEPLQAAIEFAAVGAGAGNGKRLESVYLGLDSDGETYLRVTGDDGVERSYKAVGRGGMLRGQMAKGVKSRHWDVRLEVLDATSLELDRVEWLMPISARRV
ncbi:hypothetical protein SAMN05216206_2750 [Pseudomonas guineae]|uniref:Uncharacterized protein n=1 Tax=Pseudomonas guineae TaxID=425504 RepID=A0A1I3K8L2_9PSED|nr:hypothetical protein [Pseudomonas guineae]SFI68841.1 hypothetical protein SAMN05216206_2750 [Pseudomonas guineae]